MKMECNIRQWKLEDAYELAKAVGSIGVFRKDNIHSCRILEKSGFLLEGILRQNAVKNGVVVDMKMYSRIKESL